MFCGDSRVLSSPPLAPCDLCLETSAVAERTSSFVLQPREPSVFIGSVAFSPMPVASILPIFLDSENNGLLVPVPDEEEVVESLSLSSYSPSSVPSYGSSGSGVTKARPEAHPTSLPLNFNTTSRAAHMTTKIKKMEDVTIRPST